MSDDFLGQITWQHSRPGSAWPREHTLYALHPEHEQPIGHISWGEDGEVGEVSVRPEHRRRGVATHLWNRARQISPNLMHSPEQTDEGQAWARTTSSRIAGLRFEHHEMRDKGYHRIVGIGPDDKAAGMISYREHPDGRVVHHEPEYTRGSQDAADALVGEVRRLHPHSEPYKAPEPDPEPEPTTWFHGTTVRNVKHILPANQHRRNVTFPHDTDRDHAYATADKGDAWTYAEKAWGANAEGRPRVYEVAPMGHVEKDPQFRPDGGARSNNASDYRSRDGWRVVRELRMPRHMGNPKDWDA